MSKDKNQEGIAGWLWLLLPVGLLIPITVAISYSVYFWGHDAGGPGDWGTFGDFVGGLSNPLLSFITIVLLALSLQLQAQELRESTKAVKQSAEELSLTRRIHNNQQELQIRENVRPQVAEELENKFRRCTEISRKSLVAGLTLQDAINAKGDVEKALRGKYAMTSSSDIKASQEAFTKIGKTYKVAVGSTVECLCSLIDLLDSDVVIYPLISRAETLVQNLRNAELVSFQDADQDYYIPIEQALSARKREEKFPRLHSTGINLMKAIEKERGKNKQ